MGTITTWGWGYPPRQDQAVPVPVHGDESGNAALRNAVAGLRDQLLLAVFRLVCDLVCLGEGRTQMVRRANLQSLAIRHDDIYGRGVIRSGKLIPAGAAAYQEWQGQTAVELRVPGNGHLDLVFCIFPGSMNGVRLLERCYLAQAYERPGVLGLIAECIDYLINSQRQVGMRPDPELEHGIDSRLARRSQGEL